MQVLMAAQSSGKLVRAPARGYRIIAHIAFLDVIGVKATLSINPAKLLIRLWTTCKGSALRGNARPIAKWPSKPRRSRIPKSMVDGTGTERTQYATLRLTTTPQPTAPDNSAFTRRNTNSSFSYRAANASSTSAISAPLNAGGAKRDLSTQTTDAGSSL